MTRLYSKAQSNLTFMYSTHTCFMCTHTLTHSPQIRGINRRKQQSVLWQLRQVILSWEECHCNPLMLLSHPRRVWVSVPVMIYGDRGWREWIFSPYESEREGERPVLFQTSYKCFYNAFTVSASRWHIGNQSLCLWCLFPLLSVSLTLIFPLSVLTSLRSFFSPNLSPFSSSHFSPLFPLTPVLFLSSSPSFTACSAIK